MTDFPIFFTTISQKIILVILYFLFFVFSIQYSAEKNESLETELWKKRTDNWENSLKAHWSICICKQ